MAVGALFTNAVSPTPVGSLQAYAGASAPNGWLLCDGTAVSRTLYAELFSVLSTTYGAGDASTTFNVPDMRGRMPMGAGTGKGLNATGATGTAPSGTDQTARTRGAWSGEETHLIAAGEMPSHTHTGPSHTHTGPYHNHGGLSYAGGGGGSDVATWTVGAAGAAQSSNFGYTGYAGNGATGAGGTGATGAAGGATRAAVVPPFVVITYIIKATTEVPRAGLITGGAPQIVTALPTNPVFGDVVTYIADAANGVFWYLQYDATGTYPWKFVGGAPLSSTGGSALIPSGTATTYQDVAAASVVAPLAGDYQVTFNGHSGIAAGEIGYVSLSWNGVTAVDASAGFIYGASSNIDAVSFRNLRITAVTASSTIKTQVRMAQLVSRSFSRQDLTATPIRVKAA